MRRFFLRLRSALRSERDELELEREIASHLALLEEEYRRRGLSDRGAHLAARRAMGSVALAKDLHHEARAFVWLNDLRQDLRFTFRLLRRDRAFTAVAMLTLALGIGANTAIFSLVNGVLLRPLPFEGSERLVRIAEFFPVAATGAPLAPRALIDGAELEALQSLRTLSDVGVYGGRPFSMTLVTQQGAVRLTGEQVSPGVFPMLRVRPILGRLFEPHESRPGSETVVILSHRAWLQHFDGRNDVLDRVLSLDGRGYTVVGVMPRGFEFPDSQSAFWIPFVRSSRADGQDTGMSIARIADGRTRDEAVGEVDAILSRVRPARQAGHPPDRSRFGLVSLRDEIVAPVRTAFVVLAAAVGVVLLLACANVASLLLARANTRHRELVIRVAIGAGRARLVRQTLTESLTLAFVGGLTGTCLAYGLVRLLRALGTSLPRRDLYSGAGIGIPRLDEIALDATALAFAIVAAVVTGLLCGLAPALRSAQLDLARSLRESTSRHGVRRILVAAELSAAMMLLACGGLLVHSFMKLSSVDPGYDPTNVTWFQAFLPRDRSAAQVTNFAEGMVERLGALPTISGVGYAPQIPTGNLLRDTSLRTTPQPPTRPPEVRIDARVVSPQLLNVLGVSVVAGRSFDERDRDGQPRVMLVNETLARSPELAGNPIGRRFYTIGEEPWEIVGIVEDIRLFGPDRAPGPQLFIDFRQAPTSGRNGLFIAVRTGGKDAAPLSTVLGIARGLEPLATVDSVATMEQLLANAISRPRFYAVWLGVFAVMALLLAVIGLYGLMSYAVTQRTAEIGIRMALGAQRHEMVRLVMSDSVVTTVIGIVSGAAGTAVFTRYLEGMLFGVTPVDPLTLAAAAALLAAVALLASFVPASRAMRADPLVALRSE